jgi:hypothetical protein
MRGWKATRETTAMRACEWIGEPWLAKIFDGALVLSLVHLCGGGARSREALDRRLELVQRALPALPCVSLSRVAVDVAGLLLERAAPQQGRPVSGRGGGGGGRPMIRRAVERRQRGLLVRERSVWAGMRQVRERESRAWDWI